MSKSDTETTADAGNPLHGEQARCPLAADPRGDESLVTHEENPDGESEEFGALCGDEAADDNYAGPERSKSAMEIDPAVERLRIWPPCANDEDFLDAPVGEDITVSLVHIDIASLLADADAASLGANGEPSAPSAEADNATAAGQTSRRQ